MSIQEKNIKDNPPIHINFKYKGKEYPIDLYDDITFVSWNSWGDNIWNWWWWEEGNGSCDCNRSMQIQKVYSEFPELDCGENIEMIDYYVLKDKCVK